MVLKWLLFALAVVLVASGQGPQELNGGYASDGLQYRDMVISMEHGDLPRAQTPFTYRVGTPWLVSSLPRHIDQVDRFMLVNLAGGIVAVVLLWHWLAWFPLQETSRWLLLFCYAGHWLGPVRNSLWYRPNTNAWGHVSILASLLLVGRPAWFSLSVGIGCLFRESAIFVPLACLLSRETRRAGVFGTLTGWAVLALLHLSITPDAAEPGRWCAGLGITDTVSLWMWRKHPWQIWSGFCLAFGPVLTLALFRPFLVARTQPHVLATGALILGAAAYGGSDTERIAFFAAPVLLPLFGMVLEDVGGRLRWFVIILQVWSLRLLWSIPTAYGTKEPPFLTALVPLGDHDPRALFTVFPVPGVPEEIYRQYMALALIMFLLIFAFGSPRTVLPGVPGASARKYQSHR